MNNLEWKKLDFSEIYNISNKGLVKNDKTKDLLSGTTNKDGYKVVTLSNKGSVLRNIRVDMLVYKTFVGQIETDKIIFHKDGCRFNDDVSNLELVDKLPDDIYEISHKDSFTILYFDNKKIDKLVGRFSTVELAREERRKQKS